MDKPVFELFDMRHLQKKMVELLPNDCMWCFIPVDGFWAVLILTKGDRVEKASHLGFTLLDAIEGARRNYDAVWGGD